MLMFQVQNPSEQDQLAIIQFLDAEGHQPTEIHGGCAIFITSSREYIPASL